MAEATAAQKPPRDGGAGGDGADGAGNGGGDGDEGERPNDRGRDHAIKKGHQKDGNDPDRLLDPSSSSSSSSS